MEQCNFKVNGVLSSPIDERDYTYGMISGAGTDDNLPQSFSLEYSFEPKNQGEINSCVAHSISEMIEMVKASDKLLSPGFIYENRLDSDWQGEGMVPRQALAQLVKCGIPYNDLFPVNEEYPDIVEVFKTYNTVSIYNDALTRKSQSYISLNKEDVKKYIYNEKKPVLVSLNIYDSFYDTVSDPSANGNVPLASGNKQGGHAVLITGWKDDRFVILNSWGKWGGANGYLYVLENDPLIFKEFWSITDKPIIKPTPTPVTPISPNILRPTSDSYYKVQLGAFKERENADALVKELTAKGIDSMVVIYPGLFKVQAGAFKVEDNAKSMLNKLIALGYTDAFIVTVF